MQVLGTDEFSRRVDYGQTLAELGALTLSTMENWELVSGPHFAIINFRYNHPSFQKKQTMH
ncbi:hypothetical protein MGH68_19205 [Erysipelothrix sp. D19-032]